ncbi:Site-specific recombinase XerD [Chelatococcus sambhunathii]|uniref:Site-specific recombinase XerD n=1 Tax=Chelatococcus sambhunathii TaxID=363953 RepID=A0ABP2AB53_9HYPH|nr:site-specific integrase [Chelatococcus sambhunathii]CUA90960.1 Site-specific recombinase XerD [Chelatococcus sambhunathii]
MAVRPRGNSWQVDITLGDKRWRETFSTEQAAKAWELEARAAHLRGEAIPRPIAPTSATGAATAQSRKGDTLGEALRLAYDAFWKKGPSAAKMMVNIGQVEDYFGPATPVQSIDTDAVLGFIAVMEAKGNADGTINRKLAVLSKAMKLARDRGVIDKLPNFHRRKESKNRIRFLSPEEEKALLETLASWEKPDHVEVIKCLIDTGMRPKELYALAPRDVDLKSNLISIWQTKNENPRSIYMTKRVREIVKRRIGAATAPTDKLFPYSNLWMRHVWDRARTHLGFANDEHFVPYICRHTCASRMVQRGVDLIVVKEWMGHKVIQMTLRYAHLAPKNLKAAVSVLDEGWKDDDKGADGAADEGMKKALQLLAKLGMLPPGVSVDQVLEATE